MYKVVLLFKNEFCVQHARNVKNVTVWFIVFENLPTVCYKPYLISRLL